MCENCEGLRHRGNSVKSAAMIIGLTGKNGSGKGEVAEVLKSAGYLYYSLSDMLREELRKRGKETSSKNLTELLLSVIRWVRLVYLGQ